MNSKIYFATLLIFFSKMATSQLVVDAGGSINLQTNATLAVKGDVISNASISGPGKMLLYGSASQNLNMNGNSVNNLDVDNTTNVLLGGSCRIQNSLTFTNGRIKSGNSNFILSTLALVNTPGSLKYIETNGLGFCQRELAATGSNLLLPVGTANNYTPLIFNHTGGTYSNNGMVGAQALEGKSPLSHPRTESYINVYWPVVTSNITGGTLTATGTYPQDAFPGFTGTETDVRGMSFNGTNWSLAGGSQDNSVNTVTANLNTESGQIWGMNRFLLVQPKIAIQGPFVASTGLMNDRLRTSAAYSPGNFPASNLLPLTDPYRAAPFVHVANTVVETIATTVLNDQTNNQKNIVDWVYVELRNITSPTQAPVIQTRSALLQRDGTLVDVDGLSPVYFKNVDAGSNYALSVRHRNHLGISTHPNAGLALSLANTTFDFTNTANTSLLFGTAGTNYTQLGASLKNVMWGGNARHNTVSNWSGLNNDKDFLYITTLGSNSGASLTGYYFADMNLNRIVNWSGLGNDKDFLYQQVLGNNSGTSRSQALPN